MAETAERTRYPKRELWLGVSSAPGGLALVLAVGGIAHPIDPCEGLACIWPVVFGFYALVLFGVWLVIATVAVLSCQSGATASTVARTVKVLAYGSWALVVTAAVALAFGY